MSDSLPVLLYHHIGRPLPGSYPYLSVSFETFQHHIQWLLDRGYRFLTISEFAENLRGNHQKSLLLTFDDAYAHLERTALPFLVSKGLPATMFVVTSQIGGTNAWDKNRGWKSSFRLLTEDRLRFWSQRGIQFGAHSHSHPDFRACERFEVENEVRRSKTELENVLHKEIDAFAYPFGGYNTIAREVVSRHFKLAFTTEKGTNDLRTDPHLLHRTSPLDSESILQLRLRLRYGWAPNDSLRNISLRLRRRNS